MKRARPSFIPPSSPNNAAHTRTSFSSFPAARGRYEELKRPIVQLFSSSSLGDADDDDDYDEDENGDDTERRWLERSSRGTSRQVRKGAREARGLSAPRVDLAPVDFDPGFTLFFATRRFHSNRSLRRYARTRGHRRINRARNFARCFVSAFVPVRRRRSSPPLSSVPADATTERPYTHPGVSVRGDGEARRRKTSPFLIALRDCRK